MHSNKMYNGNYLLFYPTALAGIVMTNNLFKLLYRRCRFCFLEYIGVNAMTFYTIHWILLVVVSFVATFVLKIKDPSMLFIVLLSACVFLLPLITEIINYSKNRNHSRPVKVD